MEPDFAPEIARMSYEVLEYRQSWIRVAIHSFRQTDEGTFIIKLEMDRPRTFVSIRATIEAGSPESPTWGVVGCMIEGV